MTGFTTGYEAGSGAGLSAQRPTPFTGTRFGAARLCQRWIQGPQPVQN